MNVTNKAETNENYCEHCKRTFTRTSTVLNHMCEKKHRWLERDRKSNQVAFHGWLQFYAHTSSAKKPRDYKDFINSIYYTAFIKWGNYCIGIKALNPARYLDWLLKHNVKVDSWAQDKNYDKYIVEYLRTEDPLDALTRAIEFAVEYSEEAGIRYQDIFRFGNTNRLINAITSGKISPWVLYKSQSGYEFIKGLMPEQVNFLSDYIDPVKWNITFKRHPEKVKDVTVILKKAGM